MKLRLLYTFSLVLALSVGSLSAQDNDSTKVTNAKTSGIELAFDYGKLFTLASDFESKYQGSIGYRYKNKVVITFRAGSAKLDPQNAYENGTYSSEGEFGVVSLNYLLPIDATNTLFLGLGYGLSMYKDSYSYSLSSSIWPTLSDSDRRSDLQADWFELIIGSEKRLKRSNFYLGGLFIVRKLNDYDQLKPIE
ncbi:hypothetical protein E1176_17925, partial [Fulvivirga sp. RKSG066]|uniref:DUF6048 family protein n=1 Tax=Fulvivirga aurantia TaxID=2529383 RepID=UPI0012BC1AF0